MVVIAGSVGLWRAAEEEAKAAKDNLMTYYKKPMLAAVFDLQSRLKNLVNMDFLNHFMAGNVGVCTGTQGVCTGSVHRECAQLHTRTHTQ